MTTLIEVAGHGDAAALESLFACVYDELKFLARRQLAHAAGHTLSTTELVHEAYLKLARPQSLSLRGRLHFFALTAKAMRQIVIDHARARVAEKRGGADALIVELDRASDLEDNELGCDDLLRLDRALARMEADDPALAQIVELRFFTGLSVADIAALKSTSERTVVRQWRRAKVRLYEDLHPGAAEP